MTNDQLAIAIAGVLSFAGVALLVPTVRRLALTYGITDRPAPGKLHASPTPYLGGVAIALVALGASSLLPNWSVQAGVLLLAALIVGAAGLVDDMRTLVPRVRIGVEVLAATLAFMAGARVHL